jgi:hypothetical protein
MAAGIEHEMRRALRKRPLFAVGRWAKCEHYCCVDLANLKRWGFLRPGSLRAITFGDEKPDRLWVRANADGAGLLFMRRRPDGELGKMFVTFTRSPTAFNGWRLWFCCPGCRRRCRCLYGVNPAALSQMPRACVRLTKREDLLTRSAPCR